MPLREFVHHPIAKELLHNGQTFQVGGMSWQDWLQDSEQRQWLAWGGAQWQGHVRHGWLVGGRTEGRWGGKVVGTGKEF